jgi:putative endonuclease
MLYIGMTNNLERRIKEHKRGNIKGFTSKYNLHRLIYYEEFQQVKKAIYREKELKGWRREKKKALINKVNPKWKDLSSETG